MKVYVITRARPLSSEEYVGVESSYKAAEKRIRTNFPNAKKDTADQKHISFLCKGCYALAGKVNYPACGPGMGDNEFLMFIHEEELA